MTEERIFEKRCPECGTVNISKEIRDPGTACAAIMFACTKCKHAYKNWYYGSSNPDGHPLWYEILRKPMQAICIKEEKGITMECLYDVLPGDEGHYIVVLNDHGWKNTEYPKECFIADEKRRK